MKQLKTGFGDKGGVSSCGWRARMGSARQGCSFIVDSRTPQWPDLAPPPHPQNTKETAEKAAAGTFRCVVQRDPGQLLQT